MQSKFLAPQSKRNLHAWQRLKGCVACLLILGLLTACPSQQDRQQELRRKSEQVDLETRRADHQGLNPNSGSPLPSASPSAAQDQQVSAVMGQLQGMLESYAYSGAGGSPPDIRALYARVKELNGTIQIKNPYSSMEWNDKNPSGQGVVDMYQEGYCSPGLVLYRVLKTNASGYASEYEIHGCDSAGKRLTPLVKQTQANASVSPSPGTASPAPESPSPSPSTP